MQDLNMIRQMIATLQEDLVLVEDDEDGDRERWEMEDRIMDLVFQATGERISTEHDLSTVTI